MTIEEMKKKKSEKGYSYAQMAELTGVPLSTIQKIFSGETTSPRYDTLQALEALFREADCVREEALYSVERQGGYTIEDYYALPDEQRVELIDGAFYDMAAPAFDHQRIVGEIHRQIANYIYENKGDCIPAISPVDVQLDCDNKTMVQPDVAIICHPERIRKRVVYGAPDFVLEVLSPSTRRKDCVIKMYKYEKAGVRECWFLDPNQKKLLVYFFEGDSCPTIYELEGSVPVRIYDGRLSINLQDISRWIEETGDMED